MRYSCSICGYRFTHKHRIVPGKHGGTYANLNILYLCPNHHTAWHYVIDNAVKGKLPAMLKDIDQRLCGYKDDYKFWKAVEDCWPLIAVIYKKMSKVDMKKKTALESFRKELEEIQDKISDVRRFMT